MVYTVGFFCLKSKLSPRSSQKKRPLIKERILIINTGVDYCLSASACAAIASASICCINHSGLHQLSRIPSTLPLPMPFNDEKGSTFGLKNHVQNFRTKCRVAPSLFAYWKDQSLTLVELKKH